MNPASFLQLLAVGVIVASGPLAYVLIKGDIYRKLTWVLLFLTFDLILFGGFTRLTDSGLGCPDWPGCYGLSNPVAAHQHIAAAEAAMPTGPVTVVKAWIEMLHRYLAMGVGTLTIALLVIAAVRRAQARKSGVPLPSVWPAAALLLLICVQGAFGAWTVTLKLMPVIVTTHLLLAITFLSAVGWQAARLARLDEVFPAALARKYLAFACITLAVLFVQIALGGWVSTNYAVLACPDLPLCHGKLVPDADFAAGFTLLRPLGVLPNGDLLPAAALVAIHWTHRMGALVVFIVAGAFAGVFSVACKRAGLRGSYENKLSRTLNWVLLLQLATGVSNVLFKWPLAIAVAHNGGAAALALTMTMLVSRLALRARVTAPEGSAVAGAAPSHAAVPGAPSSSAAGRHARLSSQAL